MRVSILGAFGVWAQFGPRQLDSLDPPVVKLLATLLPTSVWVMGVRTVEVF